MNFILIKEKDYLLPRCRSLFSFSPSSLTPLGDSFSNRSLAPALKSDDRSSSSSFVDVPRVALSTRHPSLVKSTPLVSLQAFSRKDWDSARRIQQEQEGREEEEEERSDVALRSAHDDVGYSRIHDDGGEEREQEEEDRRVEEEEEQGRILMDSYWRQVVTQLRRLLHRSTLYSKRAKRSFHVSNLFDILLIDEKGENKREEETEKKKKLNLLSLTLSEKTSTDSRGLESAEDDTPTEEEEQGENRIRDGEEEEKNKRRIEEKDWRNREAREGEESDKEEDSTAREAVVQRLHSQLLHDLQRLQENQDLVYIPSFVVRMSRS